MHPVLRSGLPEELWDTVLASEYNKIYIEVYPGTNSSIVIEQDYEHIKTALRQMNDEGYISWYINKDKDLIIYFD